MALDGASSWRTFRHLVLPLARGGLATIIVFSALNAWNGFLLPLILTQSAHVRVFTLGLYDFQTVSSIDAPAICAAVVLSIIPILRRVPVRATCADPGPDGRRWEVMRRRRV